MSNNIIGERFGDRKFERLSRWNLIDYTLISRNNRLAQFADNYGDKNASKLNLTCFKFGAKVYALKQFSKFDDPIILSDHSSISRIDSTNNMMLEVNSDKTKVRLYREVLA